MDGFNVTVDANEFECKTEGQEVPVRSEFPPAQYFRNPHLSSLQSSMSGRRLAVISQFQI